jgi:hypothetical protein
LRHTSAVLAAVLCGAATVGHAQGIGLGEGELPASERYTVRVEYRYYSPSLEGKIQKGFGSTPGTLLDFKDDLGIADERTYEIHGTLQLKEGHKLRGSYTPLDYQENAPHRAPRTFNFDDTRFDRDAILATNLKGSLYFAGYEWDFIRGQRGYLGAIVGARVLDVDTLLVAPEQGKREQDTVRAPAPVLGAILRLYQGRVSLEGEVTGLSVGSSGHIWDASGGVRVHFSDRIAIGGGYRYLELAGEDDPDEIEYRTAGWQFGVELSL